MVFDEFTKMVKKEVQKKLGENVTVRIDKMKKNNNVELTALHITESDCNISPTFYLEGYYDKYREKGSIDCIVDSICCAYFKNKPKEDFDISRFSDLNQIKKTFSYKLINSEKNEELLKDVPHVLYLDLAIVFYCAIYDEEFGRATILIHNNHLKLWGISKGELVKMATENTPVILPYEITDMRDIIRRIVKDELFVAQMERDKEHSFYVLTNKYGHFGAAAILYPRVLSDFAFACQRDLIILPSSVHEVIIIPVEEGEMEYDILREMVCEVNRTHVEKEELLSNEIYIYDRQLGELKIALNN